MAISVTVKEYVEKKDYNDVLQQLKKANEKISELESEMAVNDILNELKTAVPMKRVAPEFALKIAGYSEKEIDELLGNEEPLPFSSDEYEDDFPEELRSKDLNFNLVSKMLDVIELMLTDTQS